MASISGVSIICQVLSQLFCKHNLIESTGHSCKVYIIITASMGTRIQDGKWLDSGHVNIVCRLHCDFAGLKTVLSLCFRLPIIIYFLALLRHFPLVTFHCFFHFYISTDRQRHYIHYLI